MHRAPPRRSRARALAPLLFASALVAPLLLGGEAARADVLASPCEVEYFARYLDERCLMCEASEYEPERCRRAFAAAGLRQRCAGSPQGSTLGSSMWGELWCLPAGDTATALPAALPPIERVADDGDDSLAALPPIPAGFRDPPPLDPTDPSAPTIADADAEPLAAKTADANQNPNPSASASAPVSAPRTTPRAGGCLGCSVDAPPTAAATLALGLLLAARRSRRRSSRSPISDPQSSILERRSPRDR